MRATRGLPAALVVLYACSAAEPAAPTQPAPAATTTTASTNLDSTRAGGAVRPDSLVGKPGFALGDTLASIESRLAELDSARAGLAEKDRRVFDELVAASREMYEAGDVEAASLAIDDALLFLRRRPR